MMSCCPSTDPRAKNTCAASAGAIRSSPHASSIISGDPIVRRMRLIHVRDRKRARNKSPLYWRSTSRSPVSSHAVTTSAANDERRIAGSSPPAVSGETAPQASPMSGSCHLNRSEPSHTVTLATPTTEGSSMPRVLVLRNCLPYL